MARPSRGSPFAVGAAAVLLSLGVAGCITPAWLEALVYEPLPIPLDANGLPRVPPPKSEPIPDLEVEHLDVRIPSFDSIPLATDVWKPVGDGPFPVILIQSPYFEGAKDPAADNRPIGGLYGQVVDFYTERGYAVALADLRGTRQSDGCIDLGGPREQGDAYEVVEWLGTQPWSNGRVGMVGGSYDGLTQQEAAVMLPEHLAAIVPMAPVADWYHVMGKGGAKFQGWTPGTPYTYNFGIGMGLPPPGPGLVPALQELAGEGLDSPRMRRADDQLCALLNQIGADDPTGDYNAWMQERDLRPRASQAKAPMFYVHGLVDENARPDHIAPWYNDYGGPKRAFLWQMPHAAPDEDNTGRDDFWDMVHAWFDHHLLGLDNGIEQTYGVVEVQDNLGRWRNETSWPPADATPRTLFLSPGALVEDAPAATTAPIRDDPFESGGGLGSRSGQVPNTASDGRVVFVSEPLAEPLHYAGRPVVRAEVSTDRPNSFVVVRLYEVLPDGAWVLLNRGVQSLRHRDGLDQPQVAAPGETYTVAAAMQPADYVFRPGVSIGLTITAADRSYILPSGTLATNTLHLGGGAEASALLLPVIQRGPETYWRQSWGPNQPPWMGPVDAEVAP